MTVLLGQAVSYAKRDNIVAGESIYDQLEEKNDFTLLETDVDKWNYIDDSTGAIYRLYNLAKL